MISPHHRMDRDHCVEVHYENIYPIDHQNDATCTGCLTSENKIFKEYDYLSILHRPKYSVYAINPELPIITERNDSLSILPDSYNYTGRALYPSDIKIFRFLICNF
uniref:Uncharacterized protein n=1 Tax=Panagrolaimus superbus TaxID=310955 RepID=A0A914YI35_9BILA